MSLLKNLIQNDTSKSFFITPLLTLHSLCIITLCGHFNCEVNNLEHGWNSRCLDTNLSHKGVILGSFREPSYSQGNLKWVRGFEIIRTNSLGIKGWSPIIIWIEEKMFMRGFPKVS